VSAGECWCELFWDFDDDDDDGQFFGNPDPLYVGYTTCYSLNYWLLARSKRW
jgi:hypothetical protein